MAPSPPLLALALLPLVAATFTTTICSGYLNNMCATLNDADITFYISDRSGPFYSMTLTIATVWLSNPARPEVRHWTACGMQENATDYGRYNETQVFCRAVGFQGTYLVYTVRAYSLNDTVDESGDSFYIQPGAFKVLYDFQYAEACTDPTFDCPTERVNVRTRPRPCVRAWTAWLRSCTPVNRSPCSTSGASRRPCRMCGA